MYAQVLMESMRSLCPQPRESKSCYYSPKMVKSCFVVMMPATQTATDRPNRKRKDNEEDKKKDLDDLYQIVDKDNNPILCHSCFQSAKSSSGQRAIIPCSFCGLWWHLDCLDPPRAHPPNTKTWVCPCHVDNLLALVPAQLGPAHKFRKIKGSSEIHYAFRRGNVNNGWIEVDDDLSEDEARRAQKGLRDPGSWGKKYVLPASGIRDDFIAVCVLSFPEFHFISY